jgi:hypothetical protein
MPAMSAFDGVKLGERAIATRRPPVELRLCSTISAIVAFS